MKFFHLGDLHLGKRVNGFSMLENQETVLNQVCNYAEKYKPDAILISGDVYDVAMPSVNAINLMNDFIVKLNKIVDKIIIISGNHDSASRLAFLNSLLEFKGLYIVGKYTPEKPYISVTDEYGEVRVYPLPFDRSYDFDTDFENYEDNIKAVIESMNIDKNKRNVLMAHLFVTSGVTQPDTSDSEITLNSIGTIDMVDYSVFDDFNYVALGHLHKPQYIGREEVRYCGSPVCYSRSEAPIYTVDTENGYNLKRSPNSKDKSMPFVEIDDAGNANIKLLPLEPKQAMKRIKGTLNDILKASEKDEQKNDFITPDLTDTNALDVLNPIAKLREVYPYATEPVFENITSYSDIYEKNSSMASDEDMEKSICELFRAFFEQAVNDEMTNEEIAVLNEIADKFSEKEGELK